MQFGLFIRVQKVDKYFQKYSADSLVGNGILLGDKIDKYLLDSRHATKHLSASFINCALSFVHHQTFLIPDELINHHYHHSQAISGAC
jgi:hypothetical protein